MRRIQITDYVSSCSAKCPANTCGECKPGDIIMIMEVAALSYLGVGVKSPMSEWGAMMNIGKDYLQTETRLVIIPGIAIFVVSVLFNLFGDKLRDILDR